MASLSPALGSSSAVASSSASTPPATRRPKQGSGSKATDEEAAPDGNSSVGNERRELTRKESLGGALARSLFGALAFVFRAPVRLFRPVKLSSWNLLEAMAKRDGRTLSLRYMRQLLKREKASFLPHLLIPPLLANTAVGFALFEAYSLTEGKLLDRRARAANKDIDDDAQRVSKRPKFTPLHIVALSGFVAGAAQCIVSAPLDNVRIILSSEAGKRKVSARTISWRAVARAAVLPFAPALAREKLVRGGPASQAKKRSLLGGLKTMPTSAETRREWEKRWKRLRGGIHGAGLLMSLARDSVGFASFFLMFECSRRLAHHASTSIDRGIALLNSSAVLPGGMTLPYDASVRHADGEVTTSAYGVSGDLEQPRTKTGRVAAAFILVVGGAVGGILYELVGRPFELMRIVVWEGRKEWEEGRRGRGRGTNAPAKATWSGGGGRAAKVGGRAAITQREEVVRQSTRSGGRFSSYVDLRRCNSAGISASRVAASRALRHPHHVKRRGKRQAATVHSQSSHSSTSKPSIFLGPMRAKGRRERVASLTPRKSPFTHAAPHRSPKLSTRPSAWTLLVEHAQRTSVLRLTSNAPNATPTPVPIPILLWHTYMLAPYLVKPPQLQRQEGSASVKSTPTASTSGKKTPEEALRKRWTLKNPVAAPGSIRSLAAAQRWGSGRVAWALKRLASPYGVGFLVFAWMQDR